MDSGTDQKLTSVYFIDQRTGWAVGGEGIGISGAHPTIIKTENRGDEWTEQEVPASVDSNIVLNDVCFASPSVGWAVGTSTILKTTNGGETWIRQDYPDGSAQILYGIFCLDEETAVAVGTPGSRYGREYGNILKTENGETWTVVYSDRVQFADVYFKDDSLGWAVGDDGVILKTENEEIAGLVLEQLRAVSTRLLVMEMSAGALAG